MLVKGTQEEGCLCVGECGTMECSWCEGSVIFVLFDISLMMVSHGTGH